MAISTLSVAESHIFSRGATYRLMAGLEHLRFNSIRLEDSDVVVSTLEGDVVQSKDVYIKHYLEERQKLPNYFDYVGQDYSNRRLWKYGFSILPIGWISQNIQGIYNQLIQNQTYAINLVAGYSFYTEARDILMGNSNQYGYLVAPQGVLSSPPDVGIPLEVPYCSCGSFQVQWNHLEEFKQLCGNNFQPTCKHIRYLNAFEDLRNRHAELKIQQENQRTTKTMAYWYNPSEGVLRALYIDNQPSRDLKHWSFYSKPIPGEAVWSFFDQAVAHGYSLRPAWAIPALREFINSRSQCPTA